MKNSLPRHMRRRKKQSNPRGWSLEQKDKKYLWHPFTQMQEWVQEELLIIDKGQGCYLEDVNGKKYLDGVSSLWCNVHGHRVPAIDRAVKAQLNKVAHSTFLGLTHEPAILLAEQLIQLAPPGLTRVFYSDSGSEAVEIALKMAFQYWQQKGNKRKTKFVRLTNAYHGDTLGAVSVGGIDLFHHIYGPLLTHSFAAPAPYVYRWPGSSDEKTVLKESLRILEATLSANHDQIAALIMEPVMQGAAGMLLQPPGYISAVRRLTKRYNVLLILDEVATGFGRTGRMFACEHENVSPDLLTVAKGLTGGYLPLAATLSTEAVYEAFLGPYESFKTFFHGHTFTANPLACSAALASLGLLKKNRVIQHVQTLGSLMGSQWPRFYDLPTVGDIRQAGLMAGIELVRDKKTKKPFELEEQIGARVIRKARQYGAILRPLGSVIVLMPPLAITAKQLKQLLDITYRSIEDVSREFR